MEEITKDKDSMDALQSLLQIRSRGYSESSSSASTQKAPSASKNKKTESSPVQQGKKKVRASNSDGSPSKKKRARIDQHKESPSKLKNLKHESIQPQLQPRGESSASNLLQSPHHHRGLFFPSPHQAVSSLTASLGSPLSSSLHRHHHHQSNPSAANSTMAHIQLVAAQAAMAAAASAVASVSNGQRLDNSRLLSPQQQPLTPTPSTPGPGLVSLDTTPMPAAPALGSMVEVQGGSSNIRREKVEAALRSKPQRGKKRDDLSAKERLELTRTRNREHAKTTRIRKKARYQELLECESKLQALLQQQATEELQRKAVETFVSLRQNMIRCCDKGMIGYDFNNDNHHSSSTSSLTGKENEPHESSSLSSPVPSTDQVKVVTTKPVDHASILAKLVEDVNQFHLQVSPKMETEEGSSTNGAASSPLGSAMNALKAMDRQLVHRTVERYGVGAQQYCVCQVSESGIALTKQVAMAEVQLYMELAPCNRTHLQTCLLKVTFSPSQPVLLQSVSWTVLEDSLQVPASSRASSPSKMISSHASSKQLSRTVSSTANKTEDDDSNDSSLQTQSVFPSIVSLEQSKAAGQAASGGGGSGTNEATSLGMPL